MKKNLFRRYCLESTVQSLKYFYLYPDKISKFFWSFFMVFATILAFTMTSQLYNRFAQNPTRITIEDQYAPVTSLPFPAITMCSPNQLTLRNMQHFNRTLVDGNLNIDLSKALLQLLGYYEVLPELHLDLLKQLEDLIYQNRHTIPEVMTSLAQSCSDFIRLCYMADQLYDCAIFFKPILTRHGLCCIFNSPYSYANNRIVRDRNFQPMYPWLGGLVGSLSIVTDFAPQEALDGSMLCAGATRIMFNDHTEYPSDDESCMIYANVESFVLIRGTHTFCSDEVKGLPIESRRCLFEYESNGISIPGQGYRNSDCDLMCFIKLVEFRCHCWLHYMPGARPNRLCNLTEIPCVMYTLNNLAHVSKEVDPCDCPRDCDSRHYSVNMELGNLGALPFIFDNKLNNLNYNHSSSITHFSFANLFYVKQKQETVMSLINLVSNLGGVFGLCLGVSLFSVLEIIFFLYKAISVKLNYRRHQLQKQIFKK